MSSLFQVLGNVGQDAEVRTSQTGTKMAAASVALNVGFGDKKKTIWVKVKGFNKTAERIGELKKGQKVLATGTFDMESWVGKDGKQREAVCLMANSVQKFDSAPATTTAGDDDAWPV